MTKTLEVRLRDAKAEFGKADAGLARNPTMVPPEVWTQFQSLTAFSAGIEPWIEMIQTRGAARRLLDGLEDLVDANGMVPLGAQRAKYHHVRLMAVQAYLATSWGA